MRIADSSRILATLALVLGAFGVSNIARAAIPASERAALIAIYDQAHGNGWLDNEGWCAAACPMDESVPEFAPVGTECAGNHPSYPGWYGVVCDADGTHVVAIYLRGNHLVGTLADLSVFTQLTSLIVDYNQLSGPLPDLSSLQFLEYVVISANGFSGATPSLAGLTSMVSFTADRNAFDTLTPVSGLPTLRYFNVAFNQLVGPVPALTDLPSLNEYGISSNHLSGNIPDFSGAPALRYIDMSENDLIGPLPPIRDLHDLTVFAASNNHLTGRLPDIHGMAGLSFNVHDNMLIGSLPDVSGGVMSIDLGNNRLTGPLPAAGELAPGGSVICPNPLDVAPGPYDEAWAQVVVSTPWWGGSRGCNTIFADFFDER